MPTLGRHFTDIDLRIKVGGKGVTVIAAVNINNIQGMDFIEIMFGNIGSKYIGRTRIKATTQKCHKTGIGKPLLISPLPAVLKLRSIQRLVIGGIHIVNTRFETGIHNRQILIGQGDIDHHKRFNPLK